MNDDLISRTAALKRLEELDALMRRRAETEDPEFAKVQVGITLASCEIEALPSAEPAIPEPSAPLPLDPTAQHFPCDSCPFDPEDCGGCERLKRYEAAREATP